MTIEYILRHTEAGEADFESEVEEVVDGKSLPCSGGCVWPSTFKGRPFSAPVMMSTR